VASGQDEERRLVDRLSRQSEEALGRVAEELAGNPVVAGALSRAFSAREKAAQAQEAAMGALGIPSAADVERLTRRLRSVSQRLESIEDSLDRVEARLEAVAMTATEAEEGGEGRVESRLDDIARELADLREAVVPSAQLPPRSQERLTVGQAAAARPSRPGARARTAGP
jgi:CRP-like cAMP-binding protein